jgi:plastocyanin
MKKVLVMALLTSLLSCQDQPSAPETPLGELPAAYAAGGIPEEAEVEFGIDEGAVGTNFDPAVHDNSFHAFDKIRPGTVVIEAGGSVTFEIYPLHQPAVYAPGTRPEDIDTSETEPIPVLPALTRITDSTNRLALAPDQTFTEKEWTTPEGTFDEPGKYLVICATTVHFVGANMYMWVIVK